MRRALPLVLMMGCSSAEGEAGALERALAKTRPMHEIVPASEIADTPWDSSVPLAELTAHRLEAELKLELTVGEQKQALTISRSIVRQGRRFRVVERRTHREPSLADTAASRETEVRFEAIFDGELLAVRRGSGPFIERDAREGLPARLLTQQHDLAPSLLRAFGDYLIETPSPGRAPELAGLALDWRALSLDTEVRPRALDEAALAALRDHNSHVFAWAAATFRPTRAVGRIGRARGAEGPEAVLECELSLAGGFHGAAGGGGFTVELTQRVSELNASGIASLAERAPADFVLPADRLPADRPRPWKMIEDVLGADLLPPYAPSR